MEVAGFTKSFSMDQEDVLGNDQVFQALYNAPLTDAKREGVCTGLSMVWVARRMMFHDESAKQRRAGLYTTGGFRFAGRSQDIHMAAPSGGATLVDDIKANYDDALRAYVLRVVGTNADIDSGDAASMAAMAWPVARHAGCYALCNIAWTAGGAHMCASYSSHGGLGGNHFYFFDPNIGEYRIDTEDGETFLKRWVEANEVEFGGVSYLCTFEVARG